MELPARMVAMGLFDFFQRKRSESPKSEIPAETSQESVALPEEVQAGSSEFQEEPDFPFPILQVHGAEAEAALLRLRGELATGGDFPVILGPGEKAELLFEAFSEDADLVDDLAKVDQTDAEEWLAEQRRDFETDRDPEAQDQEEIFPDGSAPMTSLAAGFHYDGKPYPEILIARLPDCESWEAPLHLQFGGWNSCPLPPIHAMMARRWQEKFGAVIAVISSDTIEFTVEHPPQTDEEALALAWEQYFYCSDIVDQGVGSVATLAGALTGSTRWFFWWD